jgi:hypothetical protein
MQWLMSGGELLAGIVALIVWWLAVRLVSVGANTPFTATRPILLPMIFMLWGVGDVILVLQGARML